MKLVQPVAHAVAACTRTVIRALTATLDGLTGLVGRANVRVEAHLFDRTPLLRAYYSRPANRRAAPLPVVDDWVALAERKGILPPG